MMPPPCALQTVLGLGVLLLGGRTVLRRIFAMVANARSDETFVALCLLTVVGASLMTQALGLSETMGSFVAGVLLAETNYRTQARPSRLDAGAGPVGDHGLLRGRRAAGRDQLPHPGAPWRDPVLGLQARGLTITIEHFMIGVLLAEMSYRTQARHGGPCAGCGSLLVPTCCRHGRLAVTNEPFPYGRLLAVQITASRSVARAQSTQAHLRASFGCNRSAPHATAWVWACCCLITSPKAHYLGIYAQVEADIRPFCGLLLGLFFVTTGASLDVGLLLRK